MNIMIKRALLSGTVRAITSKSRAHRLLIASALAEESTYVECADTSRDIEATVRCLAAMGCKIKRDEGGYLVSPGKMGTSARMDCGESGSTLRFLLPVICAMGMDAEIFMEGRLPDRPVSPLREELESYGAVLSPQGKNPLTARGQITPGEYRLPGNVSSQFISGLMFALPLLEKDSSIVLTSSLESSGYIKMTEEALNRFGVRIIYENGVYRIPGRQKYVSPGRAAVEGDWSNAAFWLCASAVGTSPVTVSGLDMASSQGDRKITDILKKFGADVSFGEGRVTVSGGNLHGITIDAREIPDLVPVLSAVAAKARGDTEIMNAERLRLKESDRIKTTVRLIRAFGADVDEREDGLVIHGGAPLHGAEISAQGDHRIVMTAAVLSAECGELVKITGAEACRKSYPAFFDDFKLLGGETEEY